jgi:RimJ/RimL family protein N-acetyltransferase
MNTAFTDLLAEDRQRSFLLQADDHRLRRQARGGPQGRRPFAGAVARIRRLDVHYRPIRPTDGRLIVDAFDRLSDRSRWLRFLSPKSELTAAEVRYFTQVDHHDHEAIVAVSRLTGRGLGVARYIRSRTDPTTAEIAVTVVDAWHRMGLGSALMERLTQRARCAGIDRFSAMMSADNAGARRLIRRNGAVVTLVGREAGTLSYEIQLAPTVRIANGVRRLVPARLTPSPRAGVA